MIKTPGRRWTMFAALCVSGILICEGAPVRGQAAPSPAEIWVSPAGNDTNAGTQDAPFQTLTAAQRKARNLRRTSDPSAAKGVRILLKGGTYPLVSPLNFTPEDGGESPTSIEAAEGEKPVISGGVAIKGWAPLKQTETIKGLPAAAAGKVWVTRAPWIGGRQLEFRQMWVNGSKAIRARSPNGDECERLSGWDRKNETATFPDRRDFMFVDGPVEMVLQQQWEIAILRLATIGSAGNTNQVSFVQPESKLEFEHPWPQPILPPQGGGAFYLVNSISFLDSPGEWYEDLEKGVVYYIPREGEDLATAQVIAPALETLATISGTVDRPIQNVSFKGISFAYTTWMAPSEHGHVPIQAGMPMYDSYRINPKGTPYHPGLDNLNWITRLPAAVKVEGADHIRFERCRFEHTAASGLDFISGTHDDTIEGCLFKDIGGNGLQMGSFQEGPIENHIPYNPKDERIICQKERIANNLITDAANEDWGCVGLCAGYVREVTIEHNEVSNVSYTGISLGWGWTKLPNIMRDNKVHANRLEHVATRMCDTAGIYTLSNQPGTTIWENMVDNIKMSPYVDRPDHWFYLYTDEGSSNITLKDNWCPAEKFLKNANGPGNVWENNGPMVSDTIKNAAGVEAAYQDLLKERTSGNK